MCVCMYVCVSVWVFLCALMHVCIVTSDGMYWYLFQVSGLQVDRRIASPYQG